MKKAAFFDCVAQGAGADMLTPDFEERMLQLKERLGSLAGARVLEPGCGAGPLTTHLADWVGESGIIDAVDISTEMLHRCEGRLQRREWVRLRHGPIEEFPVVSAFYDLVLCFRVLPHLEDIPRALKLFHAGLKPSGRLVVAHLEGSAQLNAYHASVECGTVAHDVFPPRDCLQAWFDEAGFTVQQWIDGENDLFIEAGKEPK